MAAAERCVDISVLQIDADSSGSRLSWCCSSNVVAVSSTVAGVMHVSLVDIESQQEAQRIALRTDREADEHIVRLQWTAPPCARLLLAVTSLGIAHTISQTYAAGSGSRPVTVDQWTATHAWETSSSPVLAKLLEGPSCWQWPRQVQAPLQPVPGQGIEAAFGPVHLAGAQLHWLRSSLHCAAAVSQQGVLQVAGYVVAGSDQFDREKRTLAASEVFTLNTLREQSWQQHPSFDLGVAGTVLAADVAASSSGSLRVAVISGGQPDYVSIMEVTTDASNIQFVGTGVQHIANISFGSPRHRMFCCAFDATAAGDAMLIISQGVDGSVCVSRHEQASSADGSGQWSCSATQSHGSGPEQPISAAHLVTSRLGLVAWSFGHDSSWHVQVSDLYTLEASQNGVSCAALSGQGPLPGCALSPTGSCLALLHPGCRTQAPSLALSTALAAPPSLADPPGSMLVAVLALRLLWCLVAGYSAWDVCCTARHIRSSTGVAEARSILPAVLRCADQHVHASLCNRQRHWQYLSRIKMAGLQGHDGPISNVILQDMWAHAYLYFLENFVRVCKSLRDATPAQSDNPSIKTPKAGTDGGQAWGWAIWLAKYVTFFLHCVGEHARLWGGGEAPAPAERAPDADALPCIRLAADRQCMQKLQQVLQIYLTAVTQDVQDQAVQAAHARLLAASQVLNQLESSARSPEPAEGGDSRQQQVHAEAAFAAAESLADSFQGSYKLHTLGNPGAFNWAAVSALAASPAWQAASTPIAGLDPANLAGAAHHLGLSREHMPAFGSDKRPIACLPVLYATPGTAFRTGATCMQRRRWHAARDAALGLRSLPPPW